MTKAKLRYQGKMIVVAAHENGAEVELDAPKDIGGPGKDFSPTDLVGTALASCMMISMAMAAEKLGLDFSGTQAEVEKEMTSQPHRRIGRLRVQIRCNKSLSEEARQKLEKAALHCPVHASLHPDVKLEIDFVWGV